MDTNALITIRHAVDSYLNELGIYSKGNYKRFLNIVLEGYTNLNIHHIRGVKTFYDTVTDINTVDLPADFIDYIRIGMIEDGKIWTLSLNEDIALPNALDCGEYEGDADGLAASDQPWYWHYSSRGGYNYGYYRVDWDLRRVVFQGDMVARQVVIEYLSSGVNMSETTFIPRELLPVLKEYLNWVVLKRDRQAPMNRIEMARRDYYTALNEYEKLNWGFSADEFLDAIRKSWKQTLKR